MSDFFEGERQVAPFARGLGVYSLNETGNVLQTDPEVSDELTAFAGLSSDGVTHQWSVLQSTAQTMFR